MDLLTAWGVFNYGLVLLYGLLLSVSIAGGWKTRREKILVFLLCPIFLLIQSPCWLLLGVTAAKRLYPLIVHLPLALAMILGLKKPVGVTLISVCTGYLCCQLPRFVNIIVTALTGSALAGEIAYTVAIVPIYFLLRRFFVPAAQNAMADSRQTLILFGSMPVAYYLFDYITSIYTNLLYEGNRTLVEALPSMLIVFYVAFITAYRDQLQRRGETELQNSMLSNQFKQVEVELAALRRSESQSVLYRHDIRHHLAAIDGFLAADKPQQAREYIQGVCADVEAITPKRFCENELVNLLCSSYADRAARLGCRLSVEADLPQTLSIADTALCALLSNGLENALNAVGALNEPERKWISCTCGVRAGKLLIEIKNPCAGTVAIRDGLPVSQQEGHGYGCRSIQTITERNRGLCEFSAEKGLFTLRIALPI